MSVHPYGVLPRREEQLHGAGLIRSLLAGRSQRSHNSYRAADFGHCEKRKGPERRYS